MELQDGPAADAYDAIIIGSGIAGLTAGALLAKAGKKVLVAERRDAPGGYAYPFQRGPYTFDPAIHVTGQGADGQIFDSVLSYLGVRERCRMLPIGHFYAASYPGLRFLAPLGLMAYVEAHVQHFPQQAEEIRRFIPMCFQINRAAHLLPPRLSLGQLDSAAAEHPLLFKYMRSTLAEVMDEHLSDPKVKAVLASAWPYAGLPPSRLSFLTYTQMWSSFIDGTYFPQGGFRSVIDALVAGLEQHGGELVLNHKVDRILLENGHVAGVGLTDGLQVMAPVVISNADARQTFEEMIGAESLPLPYVRRLRRMRASLSACLLYAVTRLDMAALAVSHETFVFNHWDHEQTYADLLSGRRLGGMFMSVPTIVDPSLAPPGEHIVILTSLAPYDIGEPWAQARDRYREMLLDQLNQMLPGLREGLLFAEIATPETLQRYTLNSGGAAYGWEFTPDQSGSRRLQHESPIPGLYLAGHWTLPGASSLRVLLSGIHTAQMILREQGMPGAAQGFQMEDLPPVV